MGVSRPSNIAVRCYTRQATPPKCVWQGTTHIPPIQHSRVLVFDTETTTDAYQNLKIGFFRIYQDGCLQHEGLFYDPLMLDGEERTTLESYAKRAVIELYTRAEFINEVFYPEVYDLHTLCIGYNLAFDISRIALKAGKSRGRNRGGFTFTLSEDRFKPPIVVKQLGAAYSFKFQSTQRPEEARKNKKKTQRRFHFPGYFLDAQRLAEILLQVNHISLEIAGKKLHTKTQKIKGIEHGKVTEKYITYLIFDVLTTFEVYSGLLEELKYYLIQAPLTKIYSSASLGKAALKQLGIDSPLPPSDSESCATFGHIMTAYYGGRTECRIRKEPTRVTVLDFTSMYPTVTMLMNLWPFIIAGSIDSEVVTEEIREMLAQVNLTYLQDPNNWKQFTVLVKIKPDGDILPVRMDYKGSGESFNVGINHLTSDTPLWHALPDVIASCVLTGKTPEVIEAIRFVPKAVQSGLTKSEILGIPVDPKKDNLIQLLVEERQKIKQSMEGTDRNDPEYGHLESRAQAMKILVNAMSYGIFIEMNPEDAKTAIDVFGPDSFTTQENRYERPGTYFNPLLAVLITSGSRLFLAMAEAWLQARGCSHAYMDTDSVFAPVDCATDLSQFFQPLNPYTLDIPFLKIEKDKVDVLFYGISSKRYALFRYEDGEINLIDHKLHGLGHLLNPYPGGEEHWHEEIWMDVLRLHYGKISTGDIIAKYGNLFALTRLTVSTSNVWARFSKMNKGKPWRETVKPFNFVILGFKTVKEHGKAIKPLTPYSKDPQSAVYLPFIDYNTGQEMHGSHYFKSLGDTILQYSKHPEHKYEGDTGYLQRRHIHARKAIYIGKEANKIDEQPLDVQKPQIFIDKDVVMKEISSMSTAEAKEHGVERETFRQIKKRIKENGDINLNTPAVRQLIN